MARKRYSVPSETRGGGILRGLLIAILLLGAGAFLWREWDKHQRSSLQSVPQPQPEITPVMRLRRPDSDTGIVVRILRSNEVPSVQTNILPEIPPATTNVPEPNPTPPATNRPPPIEAQPGPGGYPRPVENLLEAQIALDRLFISPGCIDGVEGSQTRNALRVFQRLRSLPLSGQLSPETRRDLVLATPPILDYTVAPADLDELLPVSRSWAGKAGQTSLAHETLLERLAERHHASQPLVRKLNPALDWPRVRAGHRVRLPDVETDRKPVRAERVLIHLGERSVSVHDASTNLLAYFPCSIARNVGKRPVGELRVITIAPNPNYTFDPRMFSESAEARTIKTKLVLAPGPNNPVGMAWVGLSRPGYGIHGTPQPEQIGRTESHGCFRLANWNAERFLQMAWVGLPVEVLP